MDDSDDITSTTSASQLGFAVTPEAVAALDEKGEKARLVDTPSPVPADAPKEQQLAALIRQNSLTSVKEISEELALLAVSNNTTIPQKLSINEQLMKLAGLDRKHQEQQGGTGQGGYKLVINIGTTQESFSGVTIEQVPESVDAAV